MLHGTHTEPGISSPDDTVAGCIWQHVSDRPKPSVTIRPLRLCGWVLLGSFASLATWQLADFSTSVNGSAARAATVRELPRPELSRPNAGSGCTQARIDRATGQTTISDDCPAHGKFIATLAAQLMESASRRSTPTDGIR